MPSSPRRAAVRVPIPQMAVTGLTPIVGIQSRRIMRATPPGLANPVAVLASRRVSPMPTAHDRPVVAATLALISPASASGSSVVAPRKASSQPHTSTVTGERAQRRHHLRRRGVVGRSVGCQEDCFGTPPQGLAERHPRADPEGARLVRRCGDDLAWPMWVSIAADDHRQSGELRPAAHLDGGEELVEVDVQHPTRSCLASGHQYPRWHAGVVARARDRCHTVD